MKCSRALLTAARRLRSLHFVPAGNRKFLDKALASRADALIIDLEDSVKHADKLAARKEVVEWLGAVDFGKKAVCVRINGLDSEFWEEDLEATAQAAQPDMYMIPKVCSAIDMHRVSDVLTRLEGRADRPLGSIGLLPIVTEVPQAPLRASDIAKCPRVRAVTWGAEDLSAELGAKRRRDSAGAYLDIFKLCQSLTLLAAKSAEVQAIDTVFTDLADLAGCREEADQAADSGFDGKMTIHPAQIDEVNAAFTPSASELAEAAELIAASESQAGAFRWKGRMVDLPHVRHAQKIVALASDADTPEAAALAPGDRVWPTAPTHGKWFDELTAGMVIKHAMTRTVTETDNILFTTLSMNPASLHLDYESAKATQFGRPLVNSMFTVALLVGMSVLETTHGTTVANLGFEKVAFPKPIFYGDTLRAETEVVAARSSRSNPARGIVTFEHRAFNQHGQLVCSAQRNAMMRRKPPA